MATLSLLQGAFATCGRTPQARGGARASACAAPCVATPRASRLSSREAAASAPLRLDSRLGARAAPRARAVAPVRALTITETVVDLDTPSGKMRTYVLKPAAPGKYPGIVFYSEIFQARKRNRVGGCDAAASCGARATHPRRQRAALAYGSWPASSRRAPGAHRGPQGQRGRVAPGATLRKTHSPLALRLLLTRAAVLRCR
jgi:hypothetical protein